MHTLHMTLFGFPDISLGNQPLVELANTKASALLFYLARSQRTHTRDELAGLFWPDMPDPQARKNLRNILPALRAAVGSHLIITRHTVAFNHCTAYWLDVEQFSRTLAGNLEEASSAALWEAVELYRDDFLAGFYVRNAPDFEDWMLLEREHLRTRAIAALGLLAARHIARREYQPGVAATRRLLELEPWHELAHQQQMALLACQGQRNTALFQYDVCRRILAAEFGVEPLPETTDLYTQIKAGEPLGLAVLKRLASADQTSATHMAAPANLPPLLPAPQPALVPVGNPAPPPLPTPAAHLLASPDGTMLAESEHSPTIKVWHIGTGALKHRLQHHLDTVTTLSFSPDGALLASGSADQTICLWDVARGHLHAVLNGHVNTVTTLTFSPDGALLASGSADQTICLWDVARGTLRHMLYGHTSPVMSVTSPPRSAILVSSGSDRMVCAWEWATGARLSQLYTDHERSSYAPGFGSSGANMPGYSQTWMGSPPGSEPVREASRMHHVVEPLAC